MYSRIDSGREGRLTTPSVIKTSLTTAYRPKGPQNIPPPKGGKKKYADVVEATDPGHVKTKELDPGKPGAENAVGHSPYNPLEQLT